MFSRRIPGSHRPTPLSLRLDALRASASLPFDLTGTNPTRAGLPYDAPAILAAFGDPGMLTYEPDPRGIAPARGAVADYYASALDTVVDPERIVLTASTSEAYGYLFKLLCDPGDNVLVPHPSYPLFDLLAALESVEISSYPLRYDGAWYLDVDAVRAAITSRTRAILVVNPNNPTGSFLHRDERRALLALCREKNLALISDEVFADYALEHGTTLARTVAGETDALCFVLSGLSKVCALPQLKLGWIVCAGPDALRREAQSRLELIADSYLSVGAPVQHAAARLLAGRAPVQEAVRARMRTNREIAVQKLAHEPDARCDLLAVEGGWSQVMRVPATHDEDDWVLTLAERHGVLVQPGYFYDFPRPAYLVLSLITPVETFRAGFERILTCVRES